MASEHCLSQNCLPLSRSRAIFIRCGNSKWKSTTVQTAVSNSCSDRSSARQLTLTGAMVVSVRTPLRGERQRRRGFGQKQLMHCKTLIGSEHVAGSPKVMPPCLPSSLPTPHAPDHCPHRRATPAGCMLLPTASTERWSCQGAKMAPRKCGS